MPHIQRLLLSQLTAALRLLGQEPPSDVHIHETRRHIKRARAMLRLLRFAIGKKPFRQLDHELRDANRTLCAGRDRAVILDTLHSIGVMRPYLLPAVSSVYALLLRRLPVDTSGPATPATSARAIVVRVAQNVRRLSSSELDSGMLRTAVAARYGKSRRSFRRARRSGDVVDWHSCRRQTKYLYYQLQLLRPIGAALRQAIRQSRALEDTLGKEHDLVLLEEALRDCAAAAAAADAVATHARQRRRGLHSKAMELCVTLFADDPKCFARRCLPAARA